MASGQVEAAHPRYLGFGHLLCRDNQRVGRIYQQTFVDTCYSTTGCGQLYTTKTAITGAGLLNNRVLPFFRTGLGLIRIRPAEGTGIVESRIKLPHKIVKSDLTIATVKLGKYQMKSRLLQSDHFFLAGG